MDAHQRSVTNRLKTGQPTRHAETERGSERLREEPATGGAVRSA